MIKQFKIKDKAILKRLPSRRKEEIVTWEVLSLDGHSRRGIIRQVYDHYMTRNIGWQRFPIKFWIGSKFWGQEILVARTRKDIIDLVSRPNK